MSRLSQSCHFLLLTTLFAPLLAPIGYGQSTTTPPRDVGTSTTVGLLESQPPVPTKAMTDRIRSSGEITPINTFKATDYAVFCVAISPDGKTVAIGGSAPSRTPGGLNEGIIKLYDISSRREKATLWQSGKTGTGRFRGDESSHVRSLAFSPDGKILVGGEQFGYRLWDVSTSKELMFLPDGFAYTGAAFSPDGKTLAVPSNGHALDNKRGVRLVEVATGREMGMLPLEGNGFYSSVDFTPDGKWLVTAGQDCNVTVWDLSSRTVVFKDEVHWPLNCARFSPDGHSLVAAGEGGVVKSYMVTEKDKKLTVQNQQGSPRFLDASYSLVFAPDGKSLFVCGRTKIVVWDTQVWQQRKTFDGGNVALSRDGKLLAVADFGNRIVTIWDAVKYLEQKDAALLGPRLVGPQAGLRRSAQDEARYVAEAQAALKAYLRGEAGAAGPRPGAPNHTLDRAAAVDRFGELQEITGQGYSQAVWNIQGYDYLIAGRTARFAKGAVPLKIYVTEGGKTAPGEAAVRVTALHYDHSNGMVAYVAHPDLVAPGSP